MVEVHLRHSGDVKELVGYKILFRRKKTFRRIWCHRQNEENISTRREKSALLNVVGSLVR